MSASAPENYLQRRLAIDDLDKAIVSAAARINADTYELLVLVREFDERAGWLKWGLNNCTEWLAWRCDLGISAAREKVRVARALKELPLMSKAFAEGQLTYSKVRALTRVATAANEDVLIAFAMQTTATRVEERSRQMRNVAPGSTGDANHAHQSRNVAIYRRAQCGMMTISIDVPIESGEMIVQAIDKAAQQQPDDTLIDDSSWGAQQADAMVAIAKRYLAGDSDASGSSADTYQVVVHVDRTALTEGMGRSDLPIESVRRLTCDSSLVTMVDGENGEPLSVGRKQRTVPAHIRRALEARDGGCSFPGCNNKRFVDAHHIKHWCDGGETSIDNLCQLCDRHHRLLHEGGYEICTDHAGARYFRRPDGRAIPARGYQRVDIVDDCIDDGADVGELNLSARPLTEGCRASV